MEHEKQTVAVKHLLDLETRAESLRETLDCARAETFDVPHPVVPVKQTAEFIEPPIKEGSRFKWWSVLVPIAVSFVLNILVHNAFTSFLSFLAFPVWPLVYYFAIYRSRKEKNIEKIRNSEEYRKQYGAAKAETDEKQKKFDSEYAAAKETYDTVTVPQYRAEYEMWEKSRNDRIASAESELSEVSAELAGVYEETRLVPVQYRTIYALQYVYDMMSTSDCDIHRAIDSFDKSEQRRLDEMRLHEQQQANSLAEEQNDLLDRQNNIAAKVRRDANIAAIVGTVQRHNTNKTLKKWLGD